MHNATKVVSSVAVAGFFSEVAAAFHPTRWGFFALIVLLVVDFRYTRRFKAKSTGKTLPFCTALKIFTNKVIDYMCYLVVVAVLAATFEGAVNPDATRWIGMGIFSACDSCARLSRQCPSQVSRHDTVRGQTSYAEASA